MSLSAFGAEKKVITPVGGRAPVGPYSPGIMAGDYLYVSGQGAAKPDGSFPETAEQQIEQCLNNVKAIVEGAGLTMEHVVYAQLYLKNMAATMTRIVCGPKCFPKILRRARRSASRRCRPILRSRSRSLRFAI